MLFELPQSTEEQETPMSRLFICSIANRNFRVVPAAAVAAAAAAAATAAAAAAAAASEADGAYASSATTLILVGDNLEPLL